MLFNIFPSEFFLTIQEDFCLLRDRENKPNTPNSSQSTTLSQAELEQEALKLQAKTYLAAYRLIGAGILGASCLLAGYIILPMITLKVVSGLAAAVALCALGHDLFCISKARQEEELTKNISASIAFKNCIKTPSLDSCLNEIFLPPSFWKILLEIKSSNTKI